MVMIQAKKEKMKIMNQFLVTNLQKVKIRKKLSLLLKKKRIIALKWMEKRVTMV